MDSTAEQRSRQKPVLARGTCTAALAVTALVLCSLFNLAAVPYGLSGFANSFPGTLLFFAGLGILAGQIGALSLLLVWGKGPFLARLAIVWAAGGWLYFCWFVGLLFALDNSIVLGIVLLRARQILAVLPSISLAAQFPHWILRTYFGWRLEASEQADEASRRAPLSIRDILVGTAVVAGTVGATKLGAGDPREVGSFWLEWAIGTGVTAVVSVAFLVPLVLLRTLHPVWTIGFVLLAPIVGLVALTAMAAGGNLFGGSPDFEDLPLLYAPCVALLATCSIPLWLARLAGYRLKIG